MIERLLRGIAIGIAVVALIDPSWAVEQTVAPVIGLHIEVGGEEAAERVRDALGDDFVLTDGPVAGADARIVVGRDVPPPGAAPTFVVLPDAPIEIAAVGAPRRSAVDARVPVEVTLRASSPPDEGDNIVRLVVDGLVADERLVNEFTPMEGRLSKTTLTFTPSGAAPHHVRVIVGAQHADALVSVDTDPWRVLAHDPRPSWGATFVRRAIERDSRFDLAARIDTAPGGGVVSGDPAGLGGRDDLGDVDVILVGAPDALDDATVGLLRDYLRRLGGSVVMLIDREPGAAAELAGLADWSERIGSSPSVLRDGDAAAVLQVSEIAMPRRLPAAGRTLAGLGEGPDRQPVVWQVPVGRGLLVVSGALDAWRFRAADEGRFDRFWRDVVAGAAAAAAVPLEVDAAFRVGRPGQDLPIDVTLRELGLAPSGAGSARVSARLDGPSGVTSIRLWPVEPGRFRGRVRLPETPGPYRIEVESGADRAAADVLVLDDGAAARPIGRSRLEAWAAAQGGAVVAAADIDSLPDTLRAAITPERSSTVVHPLRSPWWLAPFVLALGGEWWLRRRRGDR